MIAKYFFLKKKNPKQIHVCPKNTLAFANVAKVVS